MKNKNHNRIHLNKGTKLAHRYITSPEKLHALSCRALEKLGQLDGSALSEIWTQIQTMIRLIGAYAKGSYREIPLASIASIVGVIIYFVSPLDAIPDFVPGGFIDDISLVLFALNSVNNDLKAFAIWERTMNTTQST